MQNNLILEKKLEHIESELSNLKSIILSIVDYPQKKSVIQLKGLLKGVNFSDSEIEEAKKCLFSAKN